MRPCSPRKEPGRRFKNGSGRKLTWKMWLLLSPEEKEAAAKDMEEIVEFANQLQAIDTENIPAAAHTAKLTNVFREDIPRQSCPRELLLENAPEQHDGCVFVPQVVE